MTSSKVVRLFFSTAIVGIITCLFMRFVVGEIFSLNYIGDVKKYIMFGLMFSIVSQMGFFAYLMINYFASGVRKMGFWPIIQLTVVGIVYFYLVFFRASAYGTENGIYPYLLIPSLLLLASIAIAFIKVRATNRTAWIPTIFFIFVFTTMEWIPGLQGNNLPTLLLMVVTLLACNAWQVMRLHELTKKES